MKICSKCNEDKKLSEFHKKGDGHQAWCKMCSNSNRVEHYHNNREHETARNAEWTKGYREWYNTLKANPCMDCGIQYPPYVMQFDHRDSNTKIAPVSILAASIKSKVKVLAEIEKCDLVCANCHAERTYQRKNIAS